MTGQPWLWGAVSVLLDLLKALDRMPQSANLALHTGQYNIGNRSDPYSTDLRFTLEGIASA